MLNDTHGLRKGPNKSPKLKLHKQFRKNETKRNERIKAFFSLNSSLLRSEQLQKTAWDETPIFTAQRREELAPRFVLGDELHKIRWRLSRRSGVRCVVDAPSIRRNEVASGAHPLVARVLLLELVEFSVFQLVRG